MITFNSYLELLEWIERSQLDIDIFNITEEENLVVINLKDKNEIQVIL